MSEAKDILAPKFKKEVLQAYRKDGYWIAPFFVDSEDKYPGVIGYGLNTGEITLLDNPLNGGPKAEKGWKSYIIANLDSPVAAISADCAGNGRQDVIICHEYGKTFLTTKKEGGNVTWLENPGRGEGGKVAEYWKQRYIGKGRGMHRLAAGYFTQKSILEIIAMPVIHDPQYMDIPIPVTIFKRPGNPFGALEWGSTLIDDKSFSIIHDGTAKRFETRNGLDTLFVASREGINWLYWEDDQWKYKHITDGIPKTQGHDFYGSACVDVGKVHGDPAAYIATIDPFHGTAVTFLTRRKQDPGDSEWVRHVIDVYGTPQQLKNNGEGPGHYVVTGDFDGDGVDECLVGLFGPEPYQGVYYYKPLDLEKGVFAKWKIADESAGRIAVGNFTGRDKLDFCTIGYSVEGYHTASEPRIMLYSHDFEAATVKPESQIVTTVWDSEVLSYIPYPTEAKTHLTAEVFEIAGYRIYLEILPPGTKPTYDTEDAVKILFGELHDGTDIHKAFNVPDFGKSEVRLKKQGIKAGEKGAVFLRFSLLKDSPGYWKKTEQIPVKSLVKFSYEGLKLPEEPKFKKVESLSWGANFKGLEFWNLSGFNFRFLDKTELCRMVFWAAGPGVDCGLHRHNDKTFLEAHICLSNGTGDGGMWCLCRETSEMIESKYPKQEVETDEEWGYRVASALEDLPDREIENYYPKNGIDSDGNWKAREIIKKPPQETFIKDYPRLKETDEAWEARIGSIIALWPVEESKKDYPRKDGETDKEWEARIAHALGSKVTDKFDKLPLATGEQNGANWKRHNGKWPCKRENGTGDYHWHKWQGGTTGGNVDIFSVFEFNPDLDYY